MSSVSHVPDPGVDIGEYCRAVEAYLTRVNDGHLVRIVGPAFDLVRGWAIEGVPLSIVFHGVAMKAERHRAGKSTRPLRIEFCDADVRAVFNGWRRAVGLNLGALDVAGSVDAEGGPSTSRTPSLSKHLERAIDRLSKVAGRLDLTDDFRQVLSTTLDGVVALREQAKTTRGAARDDIVARLHALDAALIAAVRAHTAGEEVRRASVDAETELRHYRDRLTPEAWQRSVELGVDRILRDRLGLPTLTFE